MQTSALCQNRTALLRACMQKRIRMFKKWCLSDSETETFKKKKDIVHYQHAYQSTCTFHIPIILE